MLKTIVIIVALILAGIGLFILSQKRKTRDLAAKAEAAVPPLGKFLTISTGRVHVVDEGQGQPVVLIHGLGAQMRSLTLSLLDPLKSRYRVVAIDRPGMGYSDRPETASARIDDQAGYVEEVIDQLGLENPIVLGHSLGGAIAAALALRAPHKIAGLALVAPLLRPSTKQVDAFKGLGVKSSGMRSFIAHTFAAPAVVRNQAQTMEEVFGPEQPPADYAVGGGGLLSLRPQSFFNTSRDYLSVAQVIGVQARRYDEIQCPVHVLYGTKDRLLDYREQGEETIKRYPQFDLELIEGAGHMLPLTRADACIAVVDRLAKAVKAASAPADDAKKREKLLA